MFFDRRWWGVSNQDWTIYYLKKGLFSGVSEWFEREAFFSEDCAASYPIVGCFTEYLIVTYGMARYLDFYGGTGETEREFQRVYQKGVAEMDVEFIRYLALFTVDEGIFRRIEALREEEEC